MLRAADFDFELPPELIAQQPAPRRDESRLLTLDRATGAVGHRAFGDLLEYLRPGDVLALNDSRVIPARLRARKTGAPGRMEILLLEENGLNDWQAMLRPGKRAPIGARLEILGRDGQATGIAAETVAVNAEGHRRLRFSGTENILTALESLGEVPLPPYIERPAPEAADRERYQTVFARADGSIAAPTAGLHFTAELLERARRRGVKVCFVTLHVGLGTFAPVKAEALADHAMHEERYVIGEETAGVIAEAKRGAGGRVVAVGTTTLRVLESVAAANQGRIAPGAGKTRLFIHPPYVFRAVDALLTNFHLPRSTLLMLVSAFAAPGSLAGREMALKAYAEAVARRYRFFSYGDAMLLM